MTEVINTWGIQRQSLFLKLRKIEVPEGGLSTKELEAQIVRGLDYPIITVKANNQIFRELIHEQLVDYLELRGYVVIGKSKILATTPVSYIEKQEQGLLVAALKDFEENYSKDPESIDSALHRVLTKHYDIKYFASLNADHIIGSYQEKNLDSVLTKFGVSENQLRSLEASKKEKLANQSVNLFNTGKAF